MSMHGFSDSIHNKIKDPFKNCKMPSLLINNFCNKGNDETCCTLEKEKLLHYIFYVIFSFSFFAVFFVPVRLAIVQTMLNQSINFRSNKTVKQRSSKTLGSTAVLPDCQSKGETAQPISHNVFHCKHTSPSFILLLTDLGGVLSRIEQLRNRQTFTPGIIIFKIQKKCNDYRMSSLWSCHRELYCIHYLCYVI